jgi:hypothetical protein
MRARIFAKGLCLDKRCRPAQTDRDHTYSVPAEVARYSSKRVKRLSSLGCSPMPEVDEAHTGMAGLSPTEERIVRGVDIPAAGSYYLRQRRRRGGPHRVPASSPWCRYR